MRIVKKDLKEKINKVIALSREAENEYRKIQPKNIGPIEKVINMADVIDIGDDTECSKKQKVLFEYLNELDYDTVMDIQTVMYIGINYMEQEDINPQQIFDEQRNCLGRGNKFGEIEQILSKSPLYKYLEKGIKKLKM